MRFYLLDNRGLTTLTTGSLTDEALKQLQDMAKTLEGFPRHRVWFTQSIFEIVAYLPP